MNKPYLFICWSDKSDVGKDKTAELLSEFIPITIIKFSRAFKTPLEDWLNIPYGCLDNKSFRVKKVINPVTEMEESFTYNELMYNFFHVFKQLYPTGNYLVPGQTKRTILKTPGNIAIVDLRNQTELELIKIIQDKYIVILLEIKAIGRGEQKPSDKDIKRKDFFYSIRSLNYFSINNSIDITLLDLKNQVEDIVNKIKIFIK